MLSKCRAGRRARIRRKTASFTLILSWQKSQRSRRRRRAAIGQTVISRTAAAKGLVPSIAIPRRDSKTVDQTRQVIIKLPIQCLVFFGEVVCKGCVIQPVADIFCQPLDSSQAARGGYEEKSHGKKLKI